MFGADMIYTLLSNNSAILSLVDDISNGLLPKDLGNKSTTINFYLNDILDPSLPVNNAEYTINCRAESFAKADDLSNKVITELNRTLANNYFVRFKKLPIIEPLNEIDNFNSILICNILNKY